MYKLFLTIRYLFRRRIALFAVVSVWLCTAMTLIVISVMGGFLKMIKERSRDLLGDLIVENQSYRGIPYYDEFTEYIEKNCSDVVEVGTPVIYAFGVIRDPQSNYTKPTQLCGIEFDRYSIVNAFGKGLYYNTFYPGTTTLAPRPQPVLGIDEQGNTTLPREFASAFEEYQKTHPDSALLKELQPDKKSPDGVGQFRLPDTAPAEPGYEGKDLSGIVIGVEMIAESGEGDQYHRYDFCADLGHEWVLTVIPSASSDSLEAVQGRSQRVRYVDDSYTRVYDIDRITSYVDFSMLQKLLNMEAKDYGDGYKESARASQVLFKTKDGVDVDDAALRVREAWTRYEERIDGKLLPSERRMLRTVEVDTWRQRQRRYVEAVEKEKGLITMLFGVVSIVAVVLIGCIFYMIISQKTRDIGIIKSMGASPVGVGWIFIQYAAAIGFVGATLGTITGIYFVQHINTVQDWLKWINPDWSVWDRQTYAFDRIPGIVDPTEALVIFCVAILASVLGAFVPAVLASRIWPVKALRYE